MDHILTDVVAIILRETHSQIQLLNKSHHKKSPACLQGLSKFITK